MLKKVKIKIEYFKLLYFVIMYDLYMDDDLPFQTLTTLIAKNGLIGFKEIY